MFAPYTLHRQYSSARGMTQPPATLCYCSCHPPQQPPPAVEARLCQECADERFTSWQSLVRVLMRDE